MLDKKDIKFREGFWEKKRLNMAMRKKYFQNIEEKIILLYGKRKSTLLINKIKELLEKYKENISSHDSGHKFLDEKDVILIAYGDSIFSSNRNPLKSLQDFISKYLYKTINIIHLLPFYPYSSDDGFSVVDYKEVNPFLGTWENIDDICKKSNLMFDLVINHISSKNKWFKEFLEGNPNYDNYFISFEKKPDISSVTRARTHPLFTKFTKKDKEIYLWTTFSEDQIDLNFANEKVLLGMIDIILFYCSKKARIIRLDAIGHIWKKLNSSCINLKKVHIIIQLIRAIMDEIFPDVLLVTETNVPFKKNFRYFGDGYNEAQLIYNFAIPFLVLHTFYTGNALQLLKYAFSIGDMSKRTALFNVLATHDGIGVVPVKDILTEREIKNVIKNIIQRGGYVSYKIAKNGTKKPYELNITYYSAIADFKASLELNIRKFIASQAIILSLKGLPGIYIHSLLGTENDLDGVVKTDQCRAINRKKISFQRLDELLSKKNIKESKIFREYIRLINIRKSEIAFHPSGKQRVLFIKKEIFSLLRISPDGKEKILVLLNVTGDQQCLYLASKDFLLTGKHYFDIIHKKTINIREISLNPYQVMWLKSVSG